MVVLSVNFRQYRRTSHKENTMEQRTVDMSMWGFLDTLASGAPTPGGGGAAAVAGAMAAALISMVCNLTLGRQRYAAVADEMQTLLERAETVRSELQQLADEDVVAFTRLSAAYKLPRVTDADVATRRDAIQAALRRATDVPLRTARAAAAVLPLCAPVAERGNQAAVSDVGVAVLLAQAAVRSALLNVDINLRTLEDQLYAQQVRSDVAQLTDGLHDAAEQIMTLVNSKLQSA
jgi:formiminotetrahydrofolate cyclodeaminase